MGILRDSEARGTLVVMQGVQIHPSLPRKHLDLFLQCLLPSLEYTCLLVAR